MEHAIVGEGNRRARVCLAKQVVSAANLIGLQLDELQADAIRSLYRLAAGLRHAAPQRIFGLIQVNDVIRVILPMVSEGLESRPVARLPEIANLGAEGRFARQLVKRSENGGKRRFLADRTPDDNRP